MKKFSKKFQNSNASKCQRDQIFFTKLKKRKIQFLNLDDGEDDPVVKNGKTVCECWNRFLIGNTA